MNLLTEPLLKTVEIEGNLYPIDTNFRTSIRFELLMQDGEIADKEKIIRALKLYYPKIPPNIQAACEKMAWFYRCGREENTRQAEDGEEIVETKRIYDFSYDDDYIYAAFLGQYGIDLQEVKHLHWWKFRAMFRALNDSCEFVKIMGYRGMNISAKMPKEQKAFYRKMKRLHALPLPKNEQQKVDAVTKALMNGGDVSGLL